jgi:hypothetical protein
MRFLYNYSFWESVTKGTARTLAPGTRRSCPSITTVSPAATPLSITNLLPRVKPTVTGLTSTV